MLYMQKLREPPDIWGPSTFDILNKLLRYKKSDIEPNSVKRNVMLMAKFGPAHRKEISFRFFSLHHELRLLFFFWYALF